MNPTGARILDRLAVVADERRRRDADPALARTVERLKGYQQARFRCTHADLLEHRRYRDASRFFVDELYGPRDFTRRDQEFGRIVPALVRLFPHDVVDTVMALAELHALSERLDTAMGRSLAGAALVPPGYARAWQATGEPASRDRQIALVMQVGRALERHTRSRVLRAALRAMRGPARAAGLGTLQLFLEGGFDAFAQMGDAAPFLSLIEQRESALARRLFEADAVAAAAAPARGDPLADLPLTAPEGGQ